MFQRIASRPKSLDSNLGLSVCIWALFFSAVDIPENGNNKFWLKNMPLPIFYHSLPMRSFFTATFCLIVGFELWTPKVGCNNLAPSTGLIFKGLCCALSIFSFFGWLFWELNFGRGQKKFGLIFVSRDFCTFEKNVFGWSQFLIKFLKFF